MHSDYVCPLLSHASTLCSTFLCCSPLALVGSPTDLSTRHHRSCWTTQISGKSIGSWTASWMATAKGKDLSTSLNGKASTIHLTRQAGNWLQMWRMLRNWLRHSTWLILTSLLLKSLLWREGDTRFYHLCISYTEIVVVFEHFSRIFLLYSYFVLCYKFQFSSKTLSISRMASSTFTCQAAASRIATCCLSTAVVATPIRLSTRSRTPRSRGGHLGIGVVGGGVA